MQVVKAISLITFLMMAMPLHASMKAANTFYQQGLSLKKEDPAKALEAFSKAISASDETWKRHIPCLYERGLLYDQLGNKRAAISDLMNVMRQKNDHFDASKKLAKLLFVGGQFRESLMYADQANEQNERDAEIHYIRGRLYMMKYKEGGAMLAGKMMHTTYEEFTQAIELDKKYVEAWFHRGRAQSMFGDMKKGVEDLEMALSLNPELYQAHMEIAKCYFVQKQWVSCQSSLEAALNIKPDHYASLTMLIPVLLETGTRDDAIVHIKNALEEIPGDSYLTAWLKRLGGQPVPPAAKKNAAPQQEQDTPVQKPVAKAPPKQIELSKPATAPAKKNPLKTAPPKPTDASEFPEESWY